MSIFRILSTVTKHLNCKYMAKYIVKHVTRFHKDVCYIHGSVRAMNITNIFMSLCAFLQTMAKLPRSPGEVGDRLNTWRPTCSRKLWPTSMHFSCLSCYKNKHEITHDIRYTWFDSELLVIPVSYSAVCVLCVIMPGRQGLVFKLQHDKKYFLL